MTSALTILVDADACPVKPEVYRVADRYGITVTIVANSPLAVPRGTLVQQVVVGDALDAADDWIAAAAGPGAIVVTADVPLASRCVKAGATALAPNGRRWSEAGMGLALADRNLMTDLREAGLMTSRSRPFTARDRSAFLSALDEAVGQLRRRGFG